jgi:hypothetical protein
MKGAVVYALRLMGYVHWTEAQALLALDEASNRFGFRDSTKDLLRLAVQDHFEATADTLRSAAPAEQEAEYFGAERAGEQAPSRPLTVYPIGLSDSGFELDEEAAPTLEQARRAQ